MAYANKVMIVPGYGLAVVNHLDMMEPTATAAPMP